MSQSAERTDAATRASWLPLIVVVLTQVQASFAVNALTVSMAGITTDLDTPATSVGTAITAGTFAMAAFILLGAKVGSRFGTRRVFQIAVAIHALAMLGVALSVSPAMLFIAQASSGAVIALIAPALTVFIATNYHGDRQGKAIGLLAAAIPLAGVLALIVAGWFAETIGWRWSFVLMVALGAINLLLSFGVKKVPAQADLKIDWTGAFLAAGAIILLSFGFSGLNSWGLWEATAAAPFDILGISPAPILIILGLVVGQVFFVWIGRRQRLRQSRIFDLRVLATSTELAITACMAIMLFVGTAANFLIPLYMQVVQGLSGIQTSFSIIPYTISIFLASTFVAYLYKVAPPRVIGAVGFVVVAGALDSHRVHDPRRMGAVLHRRRAHPARSRAGIDRRPRVQHAAVVRAQAARGRRRRVARSRAQPVGIHRHRRRERVRSGPARLDARNIGARSTPTSRPS